MLYWSDKKAGTNETALSYCATNKEKNYYIYNIIKYGDLLVLKVLHPQFNIQYL